MKKLHSFDEVHDSQKMFRLVLKAMSNPLQRVEITPYADKLFGDEKAFLALAYTLLDNEVTFHAFENRQLSENIQSLTLSQKTDCETADFIFAQDEQQLLYAIENAKCGTLADPQTAATVIAQIPGEEDAALTMSGPGIHGTMTIVTEPLVIEAVNARDELHNEYPQGIDLIFIDERGRLFAIPRLAKKEG